jgi:hypothetical protein
MAANAQAAKPINNKRFIWTSPRMATGGGPVEQCRCVAVPWRSENACVGRTARQIRAIGTPDDRISPRVIFCWRVGAAQRYWIIKTTFPAAISH